MNSFNFDKTAQSLVISAAETRAGRVLLANPLAHSILVAARQALRAGSERKIPYGRLEQSWSYDSLAKESISRGAMQKPKELARLIEVVDDLEPRNMLEIGTGLGGTLFALCHIARSDARITSASLAKRRLHYGFGDSMEEKIKSYASHTQILNLIRGDTHTPETRAEIVDAIGDEPLDFLLIDGDHTLEGVRKDFNDYSGLVRAGGMIAMHDIVQNPATPHSQVGVFWKELKSYYPGSCNEIIDTSTGRWAGIGTLTVGT